MQEVSVKTTGASLSGEEFNQSTTEVENAIKSADITLSGADLFQLGKALADYSARGNAYTDTGAADAYVLGVIGSKQGITSYGEGKVSFSVGNTNTGPSTVNVNGIGSRDIKNKDGSALAAGALRAGEFVTLQDNGTYYIIDSEGVVQTVTNANGTALKLPDGTLICLGETAVISTNSAIGSVFQGAAASEVFAVAFTDVPTIGESVTTDIGLTWVGRNSTLTAVSFLPHLMGSLVTDSGTLKYIAIGRWK